MQKPPNTALEELLRTDPWWRRDSLLVAVSGGLDSTALLDLLHVLSLENGSRPRLGAAYLDHGWRGREGQADAAFLAESCARRGIPFYAGGTGTRTQPCAGRRSPEAAGREARYAFLAGIARREGYAAVATAHHADDQLETLLWRLERGGCDEGLAGVLPVATIAGVEVVRPLLRVARKALVAYAEHRRLPFREDVTNGDLRFTRNRLRHLAAPRVSHADAVALLRWASLHRRLVESAAERVEQWVTVDASGHVRGPAERLALLPRELTREVLRRMFHHVADPAAALPERALDQLQRLLTSAPGGRTALRGVRAHVSCGWLLLERGGDERPHAPREGVEEVLARVAQQQGLRAAFHPAEVQGRLVVRAWKAGDRIEVGRSSRGDTAEKPTAGRKKVKDVFREARVPVWERRGYPVVADDRGVLWVPGLRRGARALPRPGSRALGVRLAPGGDRASYVLEVESG